MRRNKICGVYKFTNKNDGTVYVGASTNCLERKQEHFKACRYTYTRGYDSPFYKALRDGWRDVFDFEIIEECDKEELFDREKYWINFYDEVGNVYNILETSNQRYSTPSKPVEMLDKDTGNVLARFESIKEASREIKIAKASIQNVLKGKLRTAKGYKWRYAVA